MWKIHKEEKMKCHKCGKTMKYVKEIRFNKDRIDGWRCSCGEVYYNPEEAQRVLLLNKIRREVVRAKLGKVRSNLILRLPKNIEYALDLEKGKDVLIKIEGHGLKIIPAEAKVRK